MIIMAPDYRSPPSILGWIIVDGDYDHSIEISNPTDYDSTGYVEPVLDYELAIMRQHGVTHVIDPEFGESCGINRPNRHAPIPVDEWEREVRASIRRNM